MSLKKRLFPAWIVEDLGGAKNCRLADVSFSDENPVARAISFGDHT